MKYASIDNQLFIKNRKKFVSTLEKGSIAIFHSNDEYPSNGDGLLDFKQNSDLFYLSGIDQAKSVLVLYPEAPKPELREMLFLQETNEHIAVWEGKKLSKEEATQVSGVKTVHWLDRFEPVLNAHINRCQNVYICLNENDRKDSGIPDRNQRMAENLRAIYPQHNFKRSAPALSYLRSIKEQQEIELMQEACNITTATFLDVLKAIKPGMQEFELEAIIHHGFLSRRANGPAYHPIVASGASACVLHYNENDRECREGDLVLMDFGCSYANYASDLTRTIPVNGKFSERQKQVYNGVLKVMKDAEGLFNASMTLNELNVEAGKMMESVLKDLGLISEKDIQNQNPNSPAFKKYFMHGLGHFIGLDTHDVGDRYAKLEKGMCLTNEPGIYILDEGLGIRIENNLVVQDAVALDLFKDCPREVEEIEDLMHSP